ncbi:MAG: tetratricopeptide repeat protein [Lewinellaceae bacterium]|nr:tetratricopeptide repeat protein [Lewinellaceae bacterium]
MLTKALAYDSSIIVQGSVAEVFHENGLYPEAEDLLQKILAKDSLDEAALWLLASNKLKSGRMADAEALVKKCISINQNSIGIGAARAGVPKNPHDMKRAASLFLREWK